jgi:hypothetical protein
MNHREAPPLEVRADRRRMLGAIALATSPALRPAAALAATEGGGSAHAPDAGTARPEGVPLRYREGWLLAPGDR